MPQNVNMQSKQFKNFLGLDKVVVMPTKLSPFKSSHVTDGFHRKKMLELAFEDCPFVTVSDYELNNDTVSYTYLTVQKLKEDYPECELYILMGLDSLASFLKWRNSGYILENAILTVAGRNGYDMRAERERFKKQTGAQIHTFEYDCKISSTYVRELLFLGCSPIDFLPNKVCNYIKENQLYCGNDLHLYLQTKLKPSRLFHTAGVASTAVGYAKKLGESVDNARIAGLLHDFAKYENAENYPDCEIPSDCPNSVKHQYLGAYIAQEKLKIDNSEVLNAIRYHTTGRPNMSTLEKIVFTADLLEPSRSYDEVDYLRKLVDSDFESGFRKCLERLIVYLQKGEEKIFALTISANEYYNLKK